MPEQQPFSVLVLCTANRCRSPIAEHLFRASLGQLTGAWEVGSAGVAAHDGAPMDPLALATLAERGVPVRSWTTRTVTAELLHDADLILTMETRQRASALTRYPLAINRIFTLRQFARFVEAGRTGHRTVLDGHELIELATRGRARIQPQPPELDDIADPVGQAIGAFGTCAEVIQTAIEQILAPLPRRG